MKADNQKQNPSNSKSNINKSDEKKIVKHSSEDKDEKQTSHRTTDIQRPAKNK